LAIERHQSLKVYRAPEMISASGHVCFH